ncbi:hypothetical protein llap_16120 [Limosa lapponica baueri]|uniref:Uncharacterized protein n=1 Tax=Limosa lapponica baueri TaxID=1758121 RepID=A0A2I0TIG1_LIMLA|nr:hypothetical protein llap_16120 [Limosa lapponica baueri]
MDYVGGKTFTSQLEGQCGSGKHRRNLGWLGQNPVWDPLRRRRCHGSFAVPSTGAIAAVATLSQLCWSVKIHKDFVILSAGDDLPQPSSCSSLKIVTASSGTVSAYGIQSYYKKIPDEGLNRSGLAQLRSTVWDFHLGEEEITGANFFAKP